MPLKIGVAERLKKERAGQEGPALKTNKEGAQVSKLATISTASAFVAAGCLIFAGVTHAQTSSAMAQLQDNLATVVVAAKDIPQGAVVKESMLTSVQVPQAYVSSGAITDAKDSVGKQAVVRIDENSQLRASELAGSGNTSALSDCLGKGKKAVSIDVSTETDFAKSLLHQGDLVSLYCFEEDSGSGEAKTVRLAKDVPVMALDGYTSYADMTVDGEAASYSNVTVEVSNWTAKKIRRAQSGGESIWMVLSAAVDKGK